MTSFHLTGPLCDGAYCTVDTFRHLESDSQAIDHLSNIGRVLKKNGIYVLGLHLIPRQGITDKVHRWKTVRGKLTVCTNITVVDINHRRREETLRYTLTVTKPASTRKYQSLYKLRTYTLNQFRKLIAVTGCFEILGVYDADYELIHKIIPNPTYENLVFVLGKM